MTPPLSSTAPARGSRRGQAGFSLTELLMAIAVFTLFSGGLYAAFFAGSDAATGQRTQAAAQADSRTAVDGLARELRQAVSPADTVAPVISVTNTSLEFYSDLRREPGNATPMPNRYRYTVTAGALVKEVAVASGTPPYTYGAYGQAETLATGVQTTYPVFQAFKAGGVALTSPVAGAPLQGIKSVRIRLVLQQKTISKPTTTELVTDVTLRNPFRAV